MWYTHYLTCSEDLSIDEVTQIVSLTCSLFAYATNNWWIDLGDWQGENTPIIDLNCISFNGSKNQRLWRWINSNISDWLKRPSDDKVNLWLNWIGQEIWQWFAGTELDYPVHNDKDCSYEGFWFEFKKWFEACKTNYKPYDVVVTGFMMLLSYIAPNKIFITSDWLKKDWVLWYLLLKEATGINYKEFEFKRYEEPKEAWKPKYQGSKFNSNLTPREIWKKIKEEIKKTFPKIKVSVQTKHYNSINIIIEEVEHQINWKHYIDCWISWNRNNYQNNQRKYEMYNGIKRYTSYWQNIYDTIEKIVNSYLMDDSDSQSDYFHVNFYYNISFKYDMEEKAPTEEDFKKQLEMYN